MEETDKKNKINYPLLMLIVATITLLVGNNLLGRCSSQEQDNTNLDPKLTERSIISNYGETGGLDSHEIEVKNSDFYVIPSIHDIATSFLNKPGQNQLDSLVENGDYYVALDALDRAGELTTSDEKRKLIDNKRRAVLLMLEKGFDEVYFDFPAKPVLVVKDELEGLYSRSGKEIVPPFYDEIDPLFFTPLLCTKKNGLYGFLDEDGEELFKPIFVDVNPIFFDPLILIQENLLYGFINRKGEVVQQPMFDMVWNDSENYRVERNGDWGVIDTSGILIIPMVFDTIHAFYKGTAVARRGANQFFIDTEGERIQNPAFRN